MIGMGSIPAWMWPNAGMLTAVGVYLWWRLVVGTTRPHSSARRIGTVVAVVVVLLGPVDADRSVRPADDGATGHRLARLARLRR